MKWRHLRRTPAPNSRENCLGHLTLTEVRTAAELLAEGDQGYADHLVDQAEPDHEQCVALAILHQLPDQP